MLQKNEFSPLWFMLRALLRHSNPCLSSYRSRNLSTTMSAMIVTRRSARVAALRGPRISADESVVQESISVQPEVEQELQEKEEPRQPARKRKTKTASRHGDEAYEDEQPKPNKRKRKVREEPVYIIPDVEKKTTTFKGRLGYACLNTVLRNKYPSDESVFCSRTCRIDSIKKNGVEWLKELGRKNVQDLLTVIQWNEDHHIRFFRLSSEMFPFASHATYGYTLDYCADLLAQAGALANKYGHRLTTHPGQYTQLGSNKPAVIEAAVRELTYHCQMLDLMGIGPDGVMIVHGGGTYEDKAAALQRIKHTIKNLLPHNVRQRLVLENDEMCYNADDLLPLCEELDVPLVFDYHHDLLFPSSIPPAEVIKRANSIFARRGIRPKQHLSEPRPGAVTLMERRAHADRCSKLPDDLPDDMDLMIEAKDKEQAVFEFYRIYDLHPVKHESLRPPATNQTKETKGRKSNKRAKQSKVDAPENGDSEDAAE
ncbi:endonuclease Uve1 [Coprinopsis cinerea AmutBmut pab1-1]|nr:endonuclease Uve1 [Coprinopsis cinerea AmutBmut pab1-1]